MTEELEDFEVDKVSELLGAAESLEFQGMPIMLTDAAMMGAQAVGLSLFNLDEDKLADSANVYPGQMKDAIVTIFFCLCATDAGNDMPEDAPDRAKWSKILKRRTIGGAAMRPRMFEQVIVEFADDFRLAEDISATFELFNELWSHVFNTDVQPVGDDSGGSPGKSQSPQPSGQRSPAMSTESDTTKQDTPSRLQPSI